MIEIVARKYLLGLEKRSKSVGQESRLWSYEKEDAVLLVVVGFGIQGCLTTQEIFMAEPKQGGVGDGERRRPLQRDNVKVETC